MASLKTEEQRSKKIEKHQSEFDKIKTLINLKEQEIQRILQNKPIQVSELIKQEQQLEHLHIQIQYHQSKIEQQKNRLKNQPSQSPETSENSSRTELNEKLQNNHSQLYPQNVLNSINLKEENINSLSLKHPFLIYFCQKDQHKTQEICIFKEDIQKIQSFDTFIENHREAYFQQLPPLMTPQDFNTPFTQIAPTTPTNRSIPQKWTYHPNTAPPSPPTPHLSTPRSQSDPKTLKPRTLTEQGIKKQEAIKNFEQSVQNTKMEIYAKEYEKQVTKDLRSDTEKPQNQTLLTSDTLKTYLKIVSRQMAGVETALRLWKSTGKPLFTYKLQKALLHLSELKQALMNCLESSLDHSCASSLSEKIQKVNRTMIELSEKYNRYQDSSSSCQTGLDQGIQEQYKDAESLWGDPSLFTPRQTTPRSPSDLKTSRIRRAEEPVTGRVITNFELNQNATSKETPVIGVPLDSSSTSPR